MKKNALLTIIVVSIIIITTIIVNFNKIGYFIFTSQIKSINSYAIEDISEGEGETEAVILVGRSSCPSCIDMYKNIKTIFDEIQIKNINYYDTDKNRKNSNFEKVGDYLDIEFIPSLVYIRDGKVEHTFSPIDLDVNNIDDIIYKLEQ